MMSAAAVVIALVAVAASAGFILWPRRTRLLRWFRLRKGLVKPRYPVVLAHGLLGFDEVAVGSRRHAYFRGVRQRLESLGIVVHSPRVGALASVRSRAEELARCIREVPSKRVNIIAHSTGGLDARYAIAQLGLRKRVASLTTIGTPHRGTPVADLGTKVLGDKLRLRKLLSAAGWSPEVFYDLTTERMEQFNGEVKDVSGVFYGSVVTRANPAARALHPALRPTHGLMRWRDEPSDGLVPTSSQVWGEVLAEAEADHWGQIGWSGQFDSLALFETVVRELRARGL